ncbi:hypothetical protein OIU85_005207 [Salix viminalis]|uniref:Uncharacterized protein n=1 Tax=Salix viminalis TaxID=40686 RepID=A0A9Q0SYL0_SALVM|nr:hypothetical protein OIU85_005207 [Salix viminalis]
MFFIFFKKAWLFEEIKVCVFLGIWREIRSVGWLRCLGRDEEEEEAEVEERVDFWKGRKPDEVGGDVTVAEENGKCLYRSEEVKEIEEMEKMEEWFCVWLPTIAKYFLHWWVWK